jgi:hypothetical protein
MTMTVQLRSVPLTMRLPRAVDTRVTRRGRAMAIGGDAPPPAASRIRTNSEALIKIVSVTRAEVDVRAGSSPHDLAAYLHVSPEFVGGLSLPLGATIQRTADLAFEISLPSLQLFDVCVKPTAYSTVT